jgi:amino acid transporter
MWLARLTAFAANCNLLVIYLGYFWPSATASASRIVIIIGMVSALTLINIIGIREATITSNLFTIGKLVPLLIFIAVGLFFMVRSNFSHAAQMPSYTPFSQSVLKLIYAFTGFEMAAIPVGEVRDPRRHLPVALLTAIGVVAGCYILIQIVCIGTLPGIASSTTPLADAASAFMGPAGGALISAGALISITGNLNITLLSGSRIPFAMAEQKQLPPLLAKVHPRFFTPFVSILLTALLVFVLTLNTSFVGALTISAMARLVTYAATCIALPVFRRSRSVEEARFRLPGGTVISILALILAVWLLSNITRDEAIATLLAALVGIVVFFVSKRR